MATIPQPKLLDIPFANSGLKTSNIPNNDDTGVGNASWEKGFPEETMRLIADGGVPPHGQDMNGILNQLCLILQYLQSGTLFKYNSTFATAIGGYPKGALVLSTDKVTLWRSTVDGNTTNPDAGGAGWVNFLADLGLYLPLAGGTMTGAILSTSLNTLVGKNNDHIAFWAGTASTTAWADRGAAIQLYSTAHSTGSGRFIISARGTASGSTAEYALSGTSSGTLTWSGPVVSASDDSTKVATTAYVKDCLPKSIGSATKLTYTNANGVLTASNSTVGETNKPVYLKSGTITAISDTIGSTTKPIYVNAGVLTESNATVGSTSKPVYLNAGVITALSGNVGSTTKPVYINGGALTATNATVGSATKPMYLDAGVMTQCSSSLTDYLPLSGGSLTGSLINSEIYYKTVGSVDLSTTSANSRENTAFQVNRNPADTTNSSGNIVQLHASQPSNSHNLEVGLRVSNPRGGNIPASGTNVNTNDCWDKIGLRYNYAINRAYAYTSNPPVLDASDNRYYANHLATVGNLKTALNDYLPLAGGTMTGKIASTVFEGLVGKNDSHISHFIGTSTSDSWADRGGSLTLYSKSHATHTGEFFLAVKNESTEVGLRGKPDSTLTWGGSHIARGTAGDANTPVYVNSSGVVTSTGKSFANYLPLAGGTMTGNINRKSSLTKGTLPTSTSWAISNTTYDSAGTGTANRLHEIRHGVDANGYSFTDIMAYDFTSGSSVANVLKVGKILDGAYRTEINNGYFRIENEKIIRNSTNGWMRLTGGYPDNDGGASLLLYGKEHSTNAGVTLIRSTNGSSSTYLTVHPDSNSSFSRGLSIGGQTISASNVSIRNGNITRGTAPSQIQSHDYIYEDKDGNVIARLRGQYTTAKRHSMYMEACNDSGTFNGVLGIHMDATGTAAYTQAPTPSQTDDSTKIATTAYVKDCVPKSIGSADTPVYSNANGVITSTGKKFSDYLPLAGGAMTGSTIYRNASDNYLAIHGGTSNSDAKAGAYISLSGKDRATYGGTFRLSCTNGTSQQLLIGAFDSLTWNGAVPAASDDSTKIATTAYVKDCVPKSVGSGTKPVYTNSNGVVTASGSTVGSATQPVYLNSGTVTACTESSMLNVPGTVVMYTGTSAPSGWLYCNGAAVSRTTYAALFSAIGTGYGTGNGSSTFNLPDFRNRVPQGGSSATDRGNIAAGLPNITGYSHSGKGGFSLYSDDNPFYRLEPNVVTGSGEGNKSEGYTEGFDASRANSIYGNSTTVQPPAVKVMFIIKT